MELLYSKQTKLGNYIDLIGEPAEENILIVGVVHGDEPQGKYLIERYLEERYGFNFPLSPTTPSSKSKISVLPQGENIKIQNLAKKLRNNMTKQEVILWNHIRRRQIEGVKFRRQFPIWKYICDFISLEKKIIIEIDGSQHIESLSDRKRDEYFISRGYKILRFWNN